MVYPQSELGLGSPILRWGRLAGFGVLGLGGVALFLYQCQSFDTAVLRRSFTNISTMQWLLSALFTAISFWAVGRYDVIAHKILETGVPARAAHWSGMASIAIGQSIGVPSVVAGFVRWRALEGCSATAVAKVSGLVALAFSGCWAFLALGALWMLAGQSAIAFPQPLVVAGLCLVIGVQLVRIGRQRALPGRQLARILGWACIDIFFAAAALYIFLPSAGLPSFTTFLAIYTIALGAGIFANTPGGVGVFEAVLLGLLASDAPAEVFAAVLAYRITYYLIPFALAAIVLIRPLSQHGRGLRMHDHATQERIIKAGPGVWNLARQSGAIWGLGEQNWHVLRTPGALIGFGCDSATCDPERLTQAARAHQVLPAIYHCDNKAAIVLRRNRWHIVHVADRADLDLAKWSLDGAEHRRLRRKLRQAEKAGLTARFLDEAEPLQFAQMHRIARRWTARHGGALGVTMGQYDAGYISKQKVVLIELDDRLQGFVTFHHDESTWTLDLIRTEDALPQGAVELAIVTAIAQARQDAVQTVCLANVPKNTGWVGAICKNKAGLAQFKRSFRPRWVPLYHAAPSRLGLVLTAASLAWAIHHPPKPPRLS